MDRFKTINTTEEGEANCRSSQTVNQELDTGEIQQQPLQTLDQQSSISQTQPAIPDLQVESQESAFGEGETGSFFDEDDDTTIVNRRTNGSMHVRMDREAHENHQRSDMLLVESVCQITTDQPCPFLTQESSFNEGETWSCSVDKTAITQPADGSIQVRIYDGAHEHRQRSDMTESHSVSERDDGVGCVPGTSMQDCNVSIEEVTSSLASERTVLVTGQHGGQCKTKIPVHDYSDSSVQIPLPGIQTTQFVLARHYPPRNETCISVHFLSSQDFSEGEMCALIGTMEEQPVPFCIEHMGRQESTRYFHSAFIKDQVTVRFQLVNQVRRNFRLRDPQMAEKVITVPQIKSLSQRLVKPPGAIAEMCLQSLGEVGQLCENHLRIIMEYGGTTENMLLPIWSCGQNRHSSLQN